MAVKKNVLRNLYLIPGLLVICMIAVILCIYFFFQYQHAQTLLKNPTAAVKEEGRQIADSIRSVVAIPPNETPTVATVADVQKLNQQPFFSHAQNGDKVLVFASTKMVILYRPSVKRVINILLPSAKQMIQPTSVQITPTTSQSTAQNVARVIVLNGSKTDGLAGKTAELIENKNKYVTIVKKDSAQKSTYEKSVVIYLSEQYKKQAEQIATQLNAQTTSSLPTGEKQTDADIVIIVAE